MWSRTSIAGLLLILGVTAGALMEHAFDIFGDVGASSPRAVNEPGVEYRDIDYICPMHPTVERHEPGSCPICGMDLVLAEHVDAPPEGEMPMVHVPPQMVHNLGVRQATVARQTLWRRIDTVGYVEYDRAKLRHVYADAEGSIESLAVLSEGERVEQGQFLFELDSPRQSKHFGTVYAQRGGIVAALNVLEGTWVLGTDIVMTIADLSSVWVLADVFEGQADWVKEGQTAEVRLPTLSGRVWEGTVEYIYPNLDPKTRTLKVRMRFPNPDETLKPNMFAEVTIFGGPKQDVLSIPREALIVTGKEQRVVVATEQDHFQPRRVTIGTERGDRVEVLSGLEEGEQVVVSGQFLIDSESNLQASLARLAPPETR